MSIATTTVVQITHEGRVEANIAEAVGAIGEYAFQLRPGEALTVKRTEHGLVYSKDDA